MALSNGACCDICPVRGLRLFASGSASLKSDLAGDVYINMTSEMLASSTSAKVAISP